jgi:opacity protein-like surface antigen
MMPRTFIAALALALLAAPAFAADAIDADRPDVTNGPRALAAGVGQLEAGIGVTMYHGTRLWDVGEGLFRAGLAKGLEFRIDLPTLSFFEPSLGDGGAGWGDPGLGFKWTVPGATDTRAFGIIGDVSPQGAESVHWSGVGAFDVALNPRADLCLNAGVSRGRYESTVLASASCAFALDERTGTWLEWAGERTRYASLFRPGLVEWEPWQHVLDTGLTRRVSANTQLDVHGGYQSQRPIHSYVLGAGFAHRW